LTTLAGICPDKPAKELTFIPGLDEVFCVVSTKKSLKALQLLDGLLNERSTDVISFGFGESIELTALKSRLIPLVFPALYMLDNDRASLAEAPAVRLIARLMKYISSFRVKLMYSVN